MAKLRTWSHAKNLEPCDPCQPKIFMGIKHAHTMWEYKGKMEICSDYSKEKKGIFFREASLSEEMASYGSVYPGILGYFIW